MSEYTPEPNQTPPPARPTGGEGAPIIYRSDELLAGRREVWIEHGKDMYRLRLTDQRKLILTK